VAEDAEGPAVAMWARTRESGGVPMQTIDRSEPFIDKWLRETIEKILFLQVLANLLHS
jgi:hypothetical protein